MPNSSQQKQEIAALRQQLQEAEDILMAIRTGRVDGLTVQGDDGPLLFTLASADQAYRTLVEQMPEGTLLLMPDSTIVYANASLAALLLRPLTDVMGSLFDDLVAPAFAGVVARLLGQAWAQGAARGEVELLQHSGTTRPFSLSLRVLTLVHGNVLGVIATDLTSQREMSTMQVRLVDQQRAMHEQEVISQASEHAAAEATRLLEGIPQIAWTATPWGEPTRFNRRWFTYTGQTECLSEPRHLWAAVYPADIGPAETRWLHSLRTREPLEVECRLRNETGAYRWMLGRALPSYSEKGELLEWIGTYTDMEDQKQARQQLQASNEQLLRTNVDLDNFVYTASHDLRAPIGNIEGLLQALREELLPLRQVTEPVASLLNMMQGAVDRFLQTIGHLTDVIKLQREIDQPESWVRLLPVVEGVCLDLSPLLHTAGAQLQIEVSAELHIPLAEKNLRSVVYNLLSNALKYRHPDRLAQVRVTAWQNSQFVQVQVHDNGLGLSESQQSRLFGLFERMHTHVEGSGLGLYSLKRIVENNGGRVLVESVLHQGTVFTIQFSLPRPDQK